MCALKLPVCVLLILVWERLERVGNVLISVLFWAVFTRLWLRCRESPSLACEPGAWHSWASSCREERVWWNMSLSGSSCFSYTCKYILSRKLPNLCRKLVCSAMFIIKWRFLRNLCWKLCVFCKSPFSAQKRYIPCSDAKRAHLVIQLSENILLIYKHLSVFLCFVILDRFGGVCYHRC